MYHTKKIALFISHIYGEYQKNVCQGVIDQAAEYGFQTEVYASSDGENLGNYGIGETSILRIPNFEDFSGIIVASGTYPLVELKDQILALLKKKCTCPIIEIAEYNAQFPSVSLENNLTSGTLTEHLITVHGHKRICYLGCSSETFFSDQREQAYRNTMIKHALPVGENDIQLCGYSVDEVAAAFDVFTDNGTHLPDAFVCYNDRIALLLMVVAAQRGYQIPKDFALVGCDATREGQNATPPLTTVSFPAYQLGLEAVEQVMHLARKENVPARTCVFAEPVIGGSCGCSYHAQENAILFTNSMQDRIQDLETSILMSMKMSADFSHITDIDDGMNLLEQYVSNIDGVTEFYVCLYSNWDSLSGHIMELTDADEDSALDQNMLLLKLAIRGSHRLPECTFPKKSLLPDFINKDSAYAHIVSPLFFEEREFGYIVLGYENNIVNYHFQLVHWLMNITQLLENLCETKSASLMQQKLEAIYMRDSLTGLLNRHGYEYQITGLLADTGESQYLTAFLFDMDCLKLVNDEFGHTEGDFALEAIGQTISKAVGTDDTGTLCTRFGGDEFYVLSNRYTNENAQELINSIDKYLSNYNHLSAKPYRLSISAGYATIPYTDAIDSKAIEALIQQADANMYQNKRSKVKSVLRAANNESPR